MNLWGLDAIKTKGESVGIVLELVGARSVKEGTGRVVRYELIPLDEMDGRPRVDVLCNMSGRVRRPRPIVHSSRLRVRYRVTSDIRSTATFFFFFFFFFLGGYRGLRAVSYGHPTLVVHRWCETDELEQTGWMSEAAAALL